MHTSLPFKLLLVEDNPAEVRLIQEAMQEAGLSQLVELQAAHDGEEAANLIDKFYAEDALPDMLLLDLNIPRMDGKQILSKIKGSERYENVKVYVLTNSDNKKDMLDCYNLKADGYLQKPADFKRLVDFFVAMRKSIEARNKLSIYFMEKAYYELAAVA